MCTLKKEIWAASGGHSVASEGLQRKVSLNWRAFLPPGRDTLSFSVSQGRAVLFTVLLFFFFFHSQPLVHWVTGKTLTWVLCYLHFKILIQLHLVLFMEGKRAPISTAGEEIFQRCCPVVLLTFSQHRGPSANDQRSERNLKTKYVFGISPSLWIWMEKDEQHGVDLGTPESSGGSTTHCLSFKCPCPFLSASCPCSFVAQLKKQKEN